MEFKVKKKQNKTKNPSVTSEIMVTDGQRFWKRDITEKEKYCAKHEGLNISRMSKYNK